AIPLPLKGGTQPAMARVRLSANATAAQGTSPRRDRDTFVLKCLPRTTPCPTTSTTTTTTSTTTTSTTTTTTSSTTTTTICPNTCLNGGTLNPDCSCTCPSGYDSVNGGCFQINNSHGACGSSCDDTIGSVDGSGNFLCVTLIGFSCISSSSECPLGSACGTS